ncbi:MAG TPA: HlyD family secretion protein, partial [Candidatus Binatus sp.]|nr:HlyD family secretion protein [Candidatus Binatus sp.]
MDMNEYEHNGEELPTDSGEADRESSGHSDGALQDEIRRLRIQLERLEAFQQTPQSHESDSVDEASTDNDADHPNSPAEPKQARHRSPMRMALVAIAAVVLCVGGLQLFKYLQSYQDTDDAEVDGYLDPISTRINGTVSAVYVDNNRSVKAGQLLLQLDPSDYQVAVEQARAQLAQAQADLNSARQQYVSAVATIHQAEAQNYLAQRNAQRYTELIKLNVVSQSEFDQYDATARAQAATVKVDEAAAASAQRTIGSKEAQVQAAQAALDQAKLNLSYTRITAPADGIIGNRSAQLGQRVQPAQSLMALTQMNNLWVTANFKETQLARMRPGQPVVIHVDAVGRDYKGHVENMPGATGSLYDLLPPENATGN